MKRVWCFSRKFLVMTSIVAASAFVLSSCDKDDDDMDVAMYSISGTASGSQMVPAVTGSGTATITGTYNAKTNVMNYTTTWSALSAAPTGGGLYVGNAGEAGVAIGTTWNLGTDVDVAGTYSGQITLTDDQEDELLDGDMYYVINTSTNASGEIRGQIATSPQ
jgi:hypothetical protein